MPRLQALLALILLAAFFLPWFGGDVSQMMTGQMSGDAVGTASGFDLVWGFYRLTQQMAQTAPINFTDLLADTWFIWALIAIPLFGLLTLVTGLSGSRMTALFAFLAGIVPVGESIYGFVEAGADVFHLFDFGAFITLAAGLLLVLTSFVPRRAGI